MEYTEYLIEVGYNDNVYETKVVKILNGSFKMLQAVKDIAQKRYGTLAYVKFKRLESK